MHEADPKRQAKGGPLRTPLQGPCSLHAGRQKGGGEERPLGSCPLPVLFHSNPLEEGWRQVSHS